MEYFLPSSIPTLSEAEIESWNTFMYLLLPAFTARIDSHRKVEEEWSMCKNIIGNVVRNPFPFLL